MKYLLGRLVRMAIVVWVVTLVVFVMLRFSGDPASVLLPFEASAEERQLLRKSMGLDRPIYVQYGRYVARVLRGDFGTSVRYRLPVLSLIFDRVPPTLALTLAGMTVAILAGILLGVVQATNRGSWIDLIGTAVAILTFSMPGFWLGMILIVFFAVQLHWLPSSGMGTWKHLVLPSITLAAAFLAYVSFLVRDGVLSALAQDYVRTARAKGLPERSVLYKHTLRNALVPMVSVVALQTGTLLGGAVITESVFQWPGVGLLALQSISFRDFPVIQGTVFFLAIGVVVLNLAGDLLYTVIDPRIRYG